jgi:hypothetical protein
MTRLMLVMTATAMLVGATATGPVPPSLKKAHVISDPTGPGAGEPRLVAAPDGVVLMSWLEPLPFSGVALKVASLKRGHWSPAAIVAKGDSFMVNWANFPAVCAFGQHGLAVAWPWKTPISPHSAQLRVSLSRDGGARWSEPVVLHDDRIGVEHGFTTLVAQGEGVRAIWLDGHNLPPSVEEGAADMTLHSRFIAPSGTLGREQELDGRVCDCCHTSAVTLGDHILVAYRDRSPEEFRDISLVRLEAGRWSPPATLHADGWKIQGCPVNGPAIAASGKRVAVAWYSAATDSPRVYVAFSDDGGRVFGEPTRVDDGQPMGRVGVAVLDGGAAAVSWLEGSPVDTRLRVRVVEPGQRPQAALTVARNTGGRGGGMPQLTRDGDRLIAAWSEPGKKPRVRVAEIPIGR